MGGRKVDGMEVMEDGKERCAGDGLNCLAVSESALCRAFFFSLDSTGQLAILTASSIPTPSNFLFRRQSC